MHLIKRSELSLADTVLVIDDDTDLREIIVTGFEGSEYKAISAANGKDAIAVLEKRFLEFGHTNLDVIICDWMMPELDGLSFLNHIRQGLGAETPFVLMSGAVTRQQLVGALNFGPDAVLLKPFDLETMAQKMKDAIESRRRKGLHK